MNAVKIICKSVFAPRYSASRVSLCCSSLFSENLQWTIFILGTKEEHIERCLLHCSLECTRCTHAWSHVFCSKELTECRSIYSTQSMLEAENVIDFEGKWSAGTALDWVVNWCTEKLGACVRVCVCVCVCVSCSPKGCVMSDIWSVEVNAFKVKR